MLAVPTTPSTAQAPESSAGHTTSSSKIQNATLSPSSVRLRNTTSSQTSLTIRNTPSKAGSSGNSQALQPTNAGPTPSSLAAQPTASSQVQALLQQLYNEKKRFLSKPLGDGPLKISGFQEYEDALAGLLCRHSQKFLPRMLDKLYPTLDHVRSFTQAISSMSQANSVSTLVWGAAQVLLEVACRFSEAPEKTVDLLAEFNSSLPLMGEWLVLLRHHVALQFIIVNMYRDYLDFCISQVEYLKRKTWRRLISFGFSSSQIKIHAKATKALDDHSKRFSKQANLIATRTLIGATGQQLDSTPSSSESGIPFIILTPISHVSAASSLSQTEFPIYSIDSFRTYTFVGREEILRDMQEFLSNPEEHSSLGPSCCVIQGLGGVGKTSLAQKYCQEYKSTFEVIFTIRAESEAELQSSYMSIATKLRLEGAGDKAANIVENVKAWFEKTDKKWLLVFDNANETKHLRSFWPINVAHRNSVIVTTQKSDFLIATGLVKYIQLTSLNPEEGAKVLFNHLHQDTCSPEEEAIAQEVSSVVDGLPLALYTIGGYLRESQHSLSEFKDLFNQTSKFWLNSSFADGSESLSTVFDIAKKELNKDSRHLIEILAFLNPDDIPEDMLHLKNPPPGLELLGRAKIAEFMDMIKQLRKRHMVFRKKNHDGSYSLTIHRCLQWIILHELGQDKKKRKLIFDEAYTIVRQHMPYKGLLDIYDYDVYPQIRRCIPHILGLYQGAESPLPSIAPSKEVAILFAQAGYFLWEEGLTKDCRVLVERAEAILDELEVDPYAPERADILMVLGVLSGYDGISRRAEHFERTEQALTLWKSIGSASNPIPESTDISIWCAWADVACAVLEDEQFDLVGQIMDEYREHCEQWLCSDSLRSWYWSRYYHHISFVLMSQDKHIEAVDMAKKAADLQAEASGLDSALTQVYRFTVAQHLYYAGDFKQSLRIFKDILHDCTQLFGELNHITITAYFATGALYWIEGDKTEAERLIRISLEPQKKASWAEAYQVRAKFYLAKLLVCKGVNEEASVLEAEAIDAKDRLSMNIERRFIRKDAEDERIEFDNLVSIWDLRLTSTLHGTRPVHSWW